MTRTWFSDATPLAVKPISRMRPASSATTIAETVWPGRTRAPLVAPVMLTVGATASSTLMLTGAAATTCPLLSRAVASMVMVLPGAALAGTSKPKASTRSVAAGVTARTAASAAWPVPAR